MSVEDDARKEVRPVSVFDRYRLARPGQFAEATSPTIAAPEAADVPEEDPGGYRAYTHESTNKHAAGRLRLEYADGGVALMSYAYLMEVYCPSPQQLSLIFTNVVITLKGRRLDLLIDPLQESKVRALHCFNARRHPEPSENAPLITMMRRESLQEAARVKKGAEIG